MDKACIISIKDSEGRRRVSADASTVYASQWR
jgi:hypothetical protein